MSEFFEYPVKITKENEKYQFSIFSEALQELLGEGVNR